MKITEEEYLKAKEIVQTYELENNIVQKSFLEEEIDESRTLEDVERLEKLNDIASDLGNQFTYDMGILECEIEEALDEVSDEAKEETGYYSVEDITQNIDVKDSNSWGH